MVVESVGCVCVCVAGGGRQAGGFFMFKFTALM